MVPIKIVMVCLGNICRSPLAEGILASKLPENKFKVNSAGTGSWHIGHSPDERSILTAKKHQLDISKQKGRQFKVSDFDEFDYIYVMDNSNYQDVIALATIEEHRKKVKLILDELFPNENTTTEFMCQRIYNDIKLELNNRGYSGSKLQIKLYESHKAWAQFCNII